MRWSRSSKFLTWCVMAAAAAGCVEASIMTFLSVEDLAGASSHVVRARITGQTSRWTENHEGIVTLVDAVVVSDLGSGSGPGIPAGRRLSIVQAGGEVDGIALDWTGRPTFRVGEDLVLFLAPYEPGDPADARLLIVGGKQGRMRVVPGQPGGDPVAVQRDLAVVRSAPKISGIVPEGPAPRPDLIPFDELRQRVAASRRAAR
jgi:hypothetical protein